MWYNKGQEVDRYCLIKKYSHMTNWDALNGQTTSSKILIQNKQSFFQWPNRESSVKWQLVYQLNMASLDHSRQRIVYLITYSCADTTKFSSKESFPSAIVKTRQHFGIRVVHRVTCIEPHNNDSMSRDEKNLNHFHMALKLPKMERSLQVRNYLDGKFGIQVNF